MYLDPFINLGPIPWDEPGIISENIRPATCDVLSSFEPLPTHSIWDHGVRLRIPHSGDIQRVLRSFVFISEDLGPRLRF